MVPQPFCDNVQHRLFREDASQPRNAGLTLATVTAGYVGGGASLGRPGGRQGESGDTPVHGGPCAVCSPAPCWAPCNS